MVTDFSSRKVSGKQKGLPKNHKKVLGKLSHYKFRQRLEHKCQEYRCQYIEVTEEYTSKTCCNCGEINKNLGKSKYFTCGKCKMIMDRDTNGSVNIFIKNRLEVI
jgi:transposase